MLKTPHRTCADSLQPEVSRVLLIRGGGLGDFILILPLLRALRERQPQAHVEILGHSEIAQLACIGTYADKVVSLDLAQSAPFFMAPDARAIENTALGQYFTSFDLIISFLVDSEGHFERNLTSLVPHFLAVRPPRLLDVHATTQFLYSATGLGISQDDSVPCLRLGLSEPVRYENAAGLSLQPQAGSFLVIHPGSGSRTKNWPAQDFAAATEWAGKEFGLKVILLTGEAEQESRAEILDCFGKAPVIELHRPSLLSLASILGDARLFLGNDSGVSHLAAALGAPVLAFFGPTSPLVWRPRGNHVHILTFEEATGSRVKEEIRRLLRFTEKRKGEPRNEISSFRQSPDGLPGAARHRLHGKSR